MKEFLIIIFLFISINAFSQPWPGYNTSMYGGIHTLSYQPEIHSVMPADWDINVLSANLTFFNENFFGLDPVGDIQSGKIKSIDDIYKNHTGFVNATIQFPSVAYRINDKSTVGFSWSIRGILFSNLSNGRLSSFIDDIKNTSDAPASFDNDFARGFLISWGQYGFSYSREILNKNRNKLSAGISLNILSGAGSVYLDLSNITFNYADGALSDVDLSFKMAVTQEADELISEQKFPLFKKIGMGVDLGLTYERLKQEHAGASYFYKIGFSVNGLGKINYDNSSSAHSVNVKSDYISKESFSNIESFSQLRDTLASVFDVEFDNTNSISSRLPLDFRIYGDFYLHNRFYVHVAYTRQITYFGTEKYDELSYNQYYVVPRYESKVIGVYLPFTYNRFLDLESGVAFRWKPLVIGSGNLFSYFIGGDKSTNLDIYFATRIMINKKKNR
jgi:hypothetical protein